MANDEEKEIVRQAMGKAGRNLREIAEEVGIPYGTVRSFASTGHLSPKKLHLLKQYLAERGALPEEINARFEAAATSTLASHIAADFRNLATILLDPKIPGEIKSVRFRDLIDSYHTHMDKMVALLEKDG